MDVSLCLEFSFFSRAAAAKSLQLCPTLCDPIDGSPPGSPIPGILQARTLEWVAISFSNVWKEKWKWSRSVVSLSDPMGCSLPGSSVHGILQTRVLEWGCHCFLLFPEQRNFFFFFFCSSWAVSSCNITGIHSLAWGIYREFNQGSLPIFPVNLFLFLPSPTWQLSPYF